MHTPNIKILKMFILPGVAVIILALWVAVFYIPKNGEINDLKDQYKVFYEKAREEVPDWKVEMMKGLVDSLDAKLSIREERLYPVDNILYLGQKIEKLGEKHGLRLVSIRPDYESLAMIHQNNEEVFRLPITTIFNGSFKELTHFMDAVPDFQYVLNIEEISIYRLSGTSSHIKVETKGVIFLRKERPDESTQKNQKITNRA